MMRAFCKLLTGFALLWATHGIAVASGATMTYQGQLTSAGSSYNGNVDMTFTLWDAPSNGTQLGSPVAFAAGNSVAVSDGLFTVELDFGLQPFSANAERWIEISIDGQALTPRQRLTAAPFAANTRGLHVNETDDATLVDTLHVNRDVFGTGEDYVGIGGDTPRYLSELFGLRSPNTGYAGMFVETESDTGLPYYGYASNTAECWTYLDSPTGNWNVYNLGVRLSVANTGDVGIGTAAPNHRLDVRNNNASGAAALAARFESASTIGTWLNLGNTSAGGQYWRMISSGQDNGEGAGKLLFSNGASAGAVSSNVMVLQDNGRVGINTPTPDSALSIEDLGGVDDVGILGIGETQQEIFDLRADFAGGGSTGNGLRLWSLWDANIMSWRGDGRVGVGTSNPSEAFHVVGNARVDGSVRFRDVDERKLTYWETGAPNGLYGVEMVTGGKIRHYSGMIGTFEIGHDDGSGGFTERMRVASNGRVGIGTASPSEALHVAGNIRASGAVIASCGVLTCSDQRFKEDVKPVENALELVEKLRPVRYDYKHEEFPDRQFSQDREVGFIAQEVREVVPEVVRTDTEGYLAVDYGRLTPLLVEAVKQVRDEKDAQIKELEARLERMEQLLRAQSESK